VLHAQGKLDDAVAAYRQAIGINPDLAEAHANLGNALKDQSKLDDSIAAHRQAIRIRPEFAEAHYNLGNALHAQGKLNEAVVAHRDAIRIRSDFAEAHSNLGNALRDLGELDAAVAACRQAIRLRPAFAEAHYNLGNALIDQDKHDEAIAAFSQAIRIRPDFANGHSNLGNALAHQGRYDEAVAALHQAIRLRPAFAEAHYNLGNALAGQGSHDEAAAALHQAIRLRPAFAEAHHNLGDALSAKRKFDEAVAAFDAALAINPGLAEAWLGRGIAMALRHRYDEALSSYNNALASDPHVSYAPGYRFHARMRLCEWSQFEEDRSGIVAAVKRGERVAVPFDMLTITSSASEQLACAKILVAHKYRPVSRLVRQTVPQSIRPPARSGRDRINIAYVSADFRDHPVSVLLAGLFEQHDRSRFRITAISFGPDDDSEMRRRVKGAFEHFVDADAMTDLAVADLLQDLKIDIAVDLLGFTRDCRPAIFARRPAPIQVNYLGYPGTTGADYIDYILADRYMVPEQSRGLYSESIVYLPDSFQANDWRRPYPDRVPRRAAAGLPEDGFVFCSFNNIAKTTPEVFDVWMRLLRRVDDSVLWLLGEGATAERNIRHEAESRGIAAGRLIFAPRVAYADYLARYRAADLFLDTVPFNGGTTVSDALWAGLPVVTYSGEAFASRMAGSLLGAVGLPELATQSLAAYEQLALALATDRQRLAAIRAKLARDRTTCPLFDTDRFRRHIEAAYTTMHQRHMRGEPPASFSVTPIRGGQEVDEAEIFVKRGNALHEPD